MRDGALALTAQNIGYIAAIIVGVGIIWRKVVQPLRRGKKRLQAAIEVTLALPKKTDDLAEATRERATKLAQEAKERADRLAAVAEDFRFEVLDRLTQQDTRLSELVPNGGASMKDTLNSVVKKLDNHLQTCELIVLGSMVGGQRRTDPPSTLAEIAAEATPPDEPE